MRRKILPDISFLQQAFLYSEKERGLIWRNRPSSHFLCPSDCVRFNTKYEGKKAGSSKCFRRGGLVRYTAIKIKKQLYYEHLIVMALHGVVVPNTAQTHHIDGDPSNKDIGNLAVVSASANCHYQQPRKFSTKVRGIDFYRGLWRARVTSENKRHFIGAFRLKEDAMKALSEKKSELCLIHPCVKPMEA
jgi:hypothetical protein